MAWGCEAYVVFPPMITAPVFTPELWKYATAQFWRNSGAIRRNYSESRLLLLHRYANTTYPSITRSLLQARDLVWYLSLIHI